MSVIEFVVNYWDWYLLIGAIQAFAQIFTTKDNNGLHWSLVIIGCVIAGLSIILFWPIILLSGIRVYFQKKFESL